MTYNKILPTFETIENGLCTDYGCVRCLRKPCD
jgi:hypothetical protein